MYNIVGHRRVWYALSLVIIGVGVAFWVMGGLTFGIDFTGGTLWKLSFTDARPDAIALTAFFTEREETVSVQPSGERDVLLKLKTIDEPTRAGTLIALEERFGGVDEASFESVGPSIGAELKSRSLLAIALVLVGIILYIAWAFRKMKKGSGLSSWSFGTAAIVALVHDLAITTGAFAAFGYFVGVEIDALFITALLTVLGFSVHDTIVVFDRIREQLRLGGSSAPFATIVNASVNQTLGRSINTSLTTIFVLIALALFGGESIRFFVLTLAVGITVGTFSSIFIASQLLVSWQRIRSR